MASIDGSHPDNLELAKISMRVQLHLDAHNAHNANPFHRVQSVCTTRPAAFLRLPDSYILSDRSRRRR
jgi:hypothetical protein